jgi:hypothetical protein
VILEAFATLAKRATDYTVISDKTKTLKLSKKTFKENNFTNF